MKNPDHIYERHLVIGKLSVPPGGEWLPRAPGWSVAQVAFGTGYCLRPKANQELEPGTVVLLPGGGPTCIRASQLGELVLHSFQVVPARLTGLISLAEQGYFESAARQNELYVQILPPNHPAAVALGELCSSADADTTLFRLNLLKLFYEVFGDRINQSAPNRVMADAKDRLVSFLEHTPQGELLEMSFEELARKTRCTPRHLSRIFRDMVGQSFRAKRTELRLARARELLTNRHFKVVEVALQCGYKSLSLFSLMFARQYGASPSRWRVKYLKRTAGDGNPKSRLMGLATMRKKPTSGLVEAGSQPQPLVAGLDGNGILGQPGAKNGTALRV